MTKVLILQQWTYNSVFARMDNEIVSITNPSVVNGGQTTMVIVDESRKGTPVHQVRVPIRIVEIIQR